MAQSFKTVLIIEDDHDVRVTLRQVYEAAGYYVFTVTNGRSASELLRIIPAPKLMVCDIRMPIMDGPAFLSFKKSESQLKDVPTIIISAFPERFETFRDTVCLQKPLDLFELIRHSQALLGEDSGIPRR